MKTIAIGSGKGGVGKTSLTSNLAVVLAQQGHRVVAMDADFGLANLDVMMGLAGGATLQDLFRGDVPISRVLRMHPSGVRVLAGCSGVADLADLDAARLDTLLQELHRLEVSTDYLLIDVAAGVHQAAIAVMAAADETLLVVNEDPSSFVDAYATVKCLIAAEPGIRIRIAANEVADASGGKLLFAKFQAVVRERLGVTISLLGSLRRDDAMIKAVQKRCLVFESFPDSNVAGDLVDLASALAPNGLRIDRARSSFFSRLLRGNRMANAA